MWWMPSNCMCRASWQRVIASDNYSSNEVAHATTFEGVPGAALKGTQLDRDQEPRAIPRARNRPGRRRSTTLPRSPTTSSSIPPARSASARRRAARCARRARRPAARRATPVADNREYVEWLVEESMLARRQPARVQLSGQGSMWQNPFAHPDPRAALERASVWFTAYPLSLITEPGESFLAGARPTAALWQAFRADRHRRPSTPARSSRPAASTAGGPTPSRRRALRPHQHADRPRVRHRGASSAACARSPPSTSGTVIDDIVPGHTGKGADFRLAEMGYGDYPGIYHMVEIRAGRLAPAARRARRPGLASTSTPRPRRGSSAPATSSAGCSG